MGTFSLIFNSVESSENLEFIFQYHCYEDTKRNHAYDKACCKTAVMIPDFLPASLPRITPVENQ
jgi:hypothetical protein